MDATKCISCIFLLLFILNHVCLLIMLRNYLSIIVQAADREVGEVMDSGLVKGHGYCITDVKSIKVAKQLQHQLGKGTLKLMRLRNPWGTKEWNGPWSDE